MSSNVNKSPGAAFLPGGASGKPRTRVIQRPGLPSARLFGRAAILLYDRRLDREVGAFRPWRSAFARSLGLAGGERAKALEAFAPLMQRLVRLAAGWSRRELVVLAAGGGSIGDLAGLAAALLKRGVRLIHLPSTWLAAVDSAHGGKNALNAGGMKNQIGTFHQPERVYLVRELLPSGRPDLAAQGLAELAKMAFLAGGGFLERLEASRLRGEELLWRFLPRAVAAKMAVVRKDPEERGGERQALNLGHTLGHVLEAHLGLSHGEAVAQGLYFALRWSRARAGLSPAEHRRLAGLLERLTGFAPGPGALSGVPEGTLLRLLRGDKKAGGGGRVTVVLLRAPGKPARLAVSLAAIAAEAGRQGWVS